MKLNKGTIFLWVFNGYSMIYDHIDGKRDSLKQDLGLGFCRNQSKAISILTESHMNHSQIHHIRNNWLVSNFFSLGDSHTKECLCCFIWDLKVDTDPKGRFVSFKFTPSNDRVLCVYAPSGYSAIWNRWIGGVSMKDYEKWKINIREIKTKSYLKTLIVLWI